MEIRDRVRQTIAHELDVEASGVSDEDSLEELGAASAQLLEITLAVEELFGIEVPDTALARFRTVGDIVVFVEKRRSI